MVRCMPLVTHSRITLITSYSHLSICLPQRFPLYSSVLSPHATLGVALAWPLASYEAVTVDITRLSETRDWDKGGPGEQTRKPPQASPIDSPSALSRRWRRFLSFLRRLTGQGEGRDGKDSDGEGRVVEDPWKVRNVLT